jgi:hypothetical protein
MKELANMRNNGNTLSSFFATGTTVVGNAVLAAAMDQHQKKNDELMTNFMVEQLGNLKTIGASAKTRMKELNEAAKLHRLHLRKLVVATALLQRSNEATNIVAVVTAQARLQYPGNSEDSIRQRVKRDLTHRLSLTEDAINIKDDSLFDPQVELTEDEKNNVESILGE